MGDSYVIIPDSSAGQNLFGGQNLASELFSKLSPRNFGSNPWIGEVWNSAQMLDCSNPEECENENWDWSRLKMDSKVRNLQGDPSPRIIGSIAVNWGSSLACRPLPKIQLVVLPMPVGGILLSDCNRT